MSAAKKSALFDTSVQSKAKKVTQPGSVVSNAKPKVMNFSGISPAAKEVKKKEALMLVAKAEEYLSTSMFKWSADHLGASSKFEGASNAYKAAGEDELACQFMERAAHSHAGYGSYSAAANAMSNASKLAAEDTAKAVRLQIAASEMWGLHGDLTQTANCYATAAELSEASDPAAAEELYMRARNLLCPPDTPDTALTMMKVQALDTMRKIFVFLVRDTTRLTAALEHAHLMSRIYIAFEQDSSLYKILAAMTVIQVHMKDLVSAEQTFLDSLGTKGYVHSKECEVAETFLNAVKNIDAPAMASLQKSEEIQYLDREVQLLAAQFKLRGTATATAKVEQQVSVTTGDKELKVTKVKEIKVNINIETGKADVSGSVGATAQELQLPEWNEEKAPEGDDGEDEDLDLL